jgi:HPt (histidine-containing phosphotransfer) domain-containing protein
VDDFDPTILLDRLEEDQGLFIKIMNIFLDDVPKQMGALKEALDTGDADTVRHQAHTLKGSAGHVGATSMQVVVREMEKAGQEGDMQRTANLFPLLEQEFEKIKHSMRDMPGPANTEGAQ